MLEKGGVMYVKIFYELDDEVCFYKIINSPICEDDLTLLFDAYSMANRKFRYNFDFNVFLKYLGLQVKVVDSTPSDHWCYSYTIES